MTSDEFFSQQSQQGHQPGHCDLPAVVESCISPRNVYVAGSGNDTGTCQNPFDVVQQAHDGSPSGSVFYLAPGTYDEDPVLLDKAGKYFCERRDGSGVAVVK